MESFSIRSFDEASGTTHVTKVRKRLTEESSRSQAIIMVPVIQIQLLKWIWFYVPATQFRD